MSDKQTTSHPWNLFEMTFREAQRLFKLRVCDLNANIIAMMVVIRCSATFALRTASNENKEYQFLDMIESRFGRLSLQGFQLFREFNAVSRAASKWLVTRRQDLASNTQKVQQSRVESGTGFLDVLVDVGVEAKLFRDTKATREDLNFVMLILTYQTKALLILHEFIPRRQLSEYDHLDDSREELSKRGEDTGYIEYVLFGNSELQKLLKRGRSNTSEITMICSRLKVMGEQLLAIYD